MSYFEKTRIAGQDSTGTENDVSVSEHGEIKSVSRDDAVAQLLIKLLKEMKIMNMYNAIKTDTVIDRSDVEV